ncbi:hypothetical protein V1477_000240, partial [Vespula maculifrons]
GFLSWRLEEYNSEEIKKHDKIENSSGGSGGDSDDGDSRVVGRMEGSSRLIGHEANRTDDKRLFPA